MYLIAAFSVVWLLGAAHSHKHKSIRKTRLITIWYHTNRDARYDYYEIIGTLEAYIPAKDDNAKYQ